MDKLTRQNKVLQRIVSSDIPISGNELAKEFHVSRQIIVQDIAVLKAQHHPIVSTHKGYTCVEHRVSRVLEVKHGPDQLQDELNAIVDCGAKVEDVEVNHDIYGTLQAPLSISSRKEVKEFLDSVASQEARLLTDLTSGEHAHRVSAINSDVLDSVEEELKKLGILR